MRSVRLLFLVGVVFIGIARSEPADEYRKSCLKTFGGSLAVCMDGVLSPDDCQDMFLQNVSKCVCNNMSLEIVRLRSQVEELRQQEANCTTDLTNQITPTTTCSEETTPSTSCICNCEETIPTTTMYVCSSEEIIPTPNGNPTFPTTDYSNPISPTTNDSSPTSPTTNNGSPASSTPNTTDPTTPTINATSPTTPTTNTTGPTTPTTDSTNRTSSATNTTDPITLTTDSTNITSSATIATDVETLESGGLQGYGTILLIVGVLFLVVAALAYVAYQRKEQIWDLIFSKTNNGNKRSRKHKASHYTALPQTLHDTLHND